MAELKPCPFCGGSVTIARSSDNGMMWWFVTRGKGEKPCKCRVFMESDDFAIHDPVERKLKLKHELIAAWNRRAEDGS